MSVGQTEDLIKFLSPFKKEVSVLVLWLREFVWNLYPQTNELIYDNYNALALGWSPTDRPSHSFCTISVFRTNNNIHFGFYWGSEISDSEEKLIGNGKQYRYVLVKNKSEFPKTYIKTLLNEAYTNSLRKVKDPKQIQQGKTITKSISKNKRENKNNL